MSFNMILIFLNIEPVAEKLVYRGHMSWFNFGNEH